MTMSIGEQTLAKIKRVKRAGYSQDNKMKCLVCGNPFQTCPHSMSEVNRLITAVRMMDLLN